MPESAQTLRFHATQNPGNAVATAPLSHSLCWWYEGNVEYGLRGSHSGLKWMCHYSFLFSLSVMCIYVRVRAYTWTFERLKPTQSLVGRKLSQQQKPEKTKGVFNQVPNKRPHATVKSVLVFQERQCRWRKHVSRTRPGNWVWPQIVGP